MEFVPKDLMIVRLEVPQNDAQGELRSCVLLTRRLCDACENVPNVKTASIAVLEPYARVIGETKTGFQLWAQQQHGVKSLPKSSKHSLH